MTTGEKSERRAARVVPSVVGVVGVVAVGVLASGLACGERAEPLVPAPDAEPAAEAPAPLAPEGVLPLAYLREHVGQYPREFGLFEGEPLKTRLVALLGDRLPVLLENFGTQGPLGAEGSVLYAIGNKPHAAGDGQAILLVDVERDLVNVTLMDAHEMQQIRERGEAIDDLPHDVRVALANWEEFARGE